MSERRWLLGLCLTGAVLAFVALRAPEPTYVAPRHEAPLRFPLALTEEPLPGYVVRAFAVEGICCQGCGGKLGRALLAIDGVQEVAVDHLKGEVRASVRADVESEVLARALTFDKYSAEAH
jgi:copper chaperone CopZ